MDRILVTGGNGFIGRHLVARLCDAGFQLTLAQRASYEAASRNQIRFVAIGDVSDRTDWRRALDSCTMVVHLAGQVPRKGHDPAEFHVVNAAGTARLIEQAEAAGIRRFVYLSSVSAMVESGSDLAIGDTSAPAASLSPYGASKRAAETHVEAFARRGGVGISIRPPLVYAWDAKGRWHTLQRLAASGLPLPFGLVRNRRSLIALENLVDALTTVVTARDEAISGAYFVADDRAVSVCEIFTWLRRGMGLPPRLFPVPQAAFHVLLGLAGLQNAGDRLLGDLMIDSSRFQETFKWSPRLQPDQAITRSGAEYRSA